VPSAAAALRKILLIDGGVKGAAVAGEGVAPTAATEISRCRWQFGKGVANSDWDACSVIGQL
jgi:hypothetical protein